MLAPAAPLSDPTRLPYPATRKADVVEEYHGVKVEDPYRWLEDDNSPETKQWVEAQNRVTFNFLEQIPARPKIRHRLEQLWNYERFGVPQKEGARYFFTRNSGLQNQPVLLVADSLEGDARVLLDPNTLSPDGTVALTGWVPSPDGNLLAYGLSRSGSDWEDWRVRDVRTGRDLDDLLEWTKFTAVSWARDGRGFYYTRFDAPPPGEQHKGLTEYQKLAFHRLGTKQPDDPLVYERRDHKDWGFPACVTEDGRWLVITVTRGTEPENGIFYQDLTTPGSPVVELLAEFDAAYTFIDNDGPLLYFRTDLDAPRGRVVVIDLGNPDGVEWEEVIPEAAEALDAVSLVGGKFFCTYMKDAHSVVRTFTPNRAKPAVASGELTLPGLGTVEGLNGWRSQTETFYSYTSFTQPETIFHLDIQSGRTRPFREPKVQFDPAAYETRQVFFPSKDGTRIPMFITHQRGLPLDGNRPTRLYGYGGFMVSLTPGFGVSDLAWMEMGGVSVEANLRGGGEYGREWNTAGVVLQKQNVFDDFIAAAEWLIANGYTNPRKLAIAGGSNGGLLVGACMTQRPELFAAALPAVGVLDMLRFHKFTIGWAWSSDYGTSDDPEQFRALHAYSPLHRLRPGVRYPATLITTADHDDRVVPAHSFKFAARLQECQAPDGPPVLIRIETKAGHGAGQALSKTIDQRADELAFLTWALGVEAP
jgi:prolyl oligopeptidase